MKIAVVGRGNVGGGLADLWESAGHEVTRIGREGGDVSEEEASAETIQGDGDVNILMDIHTHTVIISAVVVGIDRGLFYRRTSAKSTLEKPPSRFSKHFLRLSEKGCERQALGAPCWASHCLLPRELDWKLTNRPRSFTPIFTPTHPNIIRLRPTRPNEAPPIIRIPRASSDIIRHPDTRWPA